MRSSTNTVVRRSAAAIAAISALALTLGGAPASQAATTVDGTGTVTVTADPTPPTTEPTTTPTTTDPATTTGPTTTSTPSKSCVLPPRAPWRINAIRDASDPTTFVVNWGSVACATRYNISIFSKTAGRRPVGRFLADVVHGDECRSDGDVPDPGRAVAMTQGEGASTPTYYLRPAVPQGVSGPSRQLHRHHDGDTRWQAPVPCDARRATAEGQAPARRQSGSSTARSPGAPRAPSWRDSMLAASS